MTADRILLTGLRVRGHHGVLPHEAQLGQVFVVDLELAVDLAPNPEGVGGPLLNHLGQAVGIVTESAPPTGGRRALTLAIPVDRIKSILSSLK